jgi:hypothetical protein
MSNMTNLISNDTLECLEFLETKIVFFLVESVMSYKLQSFKLLGNFDRPPHIFFLGNLWYFFLGNLWAIFLGAWLAYRDRYGPIFTVWFGETPMVMIADSDLILETIKKDSLAYAGRFFFNDHFTHFKCKWPFF